MAEDTQKDWRELCVAVTNEIDSTKLSSRVQELIDELDKVRAKLASVSRNRVEEKGWMPKRPALRDDFGTKY